MQENYRVLIIGIIGFGLKLHEWETDVLSTRVCVHSLEEMVKIQEAENVVVHKHVIYQVLFLYLLLGSVVS
jgi:hypothetical protein